MKNKPFRIITLKQRIIVFFGILFVFIPFSVFIFWLGLDTLIDNLNFSSSLFFSWQTILTLFSPFIFVPIIIMGLPVLFLGKDLPMKYTVPLIRIMIWGCVLAVFVAVLYAFYFTNELERRGYVPCRGIPSGYMPGMGKQYVTDLSLCNK